MPNCNKISSFLKLPDLAITFLLVLMAELVSGQAIYVAATGNDHNPGTAARPVASLARAQQLARSYPRNRSVEVIVGNGIYYLPEPLRFSAADSRTSRARLVFRAAEEGKAIISGGRKLALQWKPLANGIYQARVPEGISIDQLYVNGTRQRMARYPNAVKGKNVFDAWSLDHAAAPDTAADALNPQRIARWKHPAGGYIHAMQEYLWGDMHWLITGKTADGQLRYEGGWQNNRPSNMHPVYRMVENIFEELDAPGEWYFDQAKRILYYQPENGLELADATIEIVRLQQLISVKGDPGKPVSGLSFKGFVFRHAARSFMENREPLLRSDWTMFRGAAFVLEQATDCSVEDCEFDQVGGNAVLVNRFARRIQISGCYIHHAGANGIAFVGDPASVRSPLFRYGPQDYAGIDRRPGPKSDQYPEDCTVENCLITLTGRDEKQTAPVQISMAHRIRVSHCSIYDVPRAGINISEGTFGGHIIEYCDVFNTVLETGDHGSFNSWGRDRYWTPDVSATATQVDADTSLPWLDMLEPNIIRNSRWRCDHGWDIDLDDGSSHYRIYNNVLLNGGLKLREGYDRIATNNIILNNSLHPHVWYHHSRDVFTKNIVYTAYQPAIMEQDNGAEGHWGKEIDHNLFVCDSVQKNQFRRNGCDEHSLVGDPQFTDPAKGLYQVAAGSPATALGFQNFAMEFGVTKPSLKAIAKQPRLPELLPVVTAAPKGPVTSWMGATLYQPRGAELSAFGIGFNAGGVAMPEVPAQSPAAMAGFQKGDLIQSINGNTIDSITTLQQYLGSSAARQQEQVFRLIRHQAPFELILHPPLPQLLTTVKQSEWMGFPRTDFTYAGRSCLLVAPRQALPQHRWIWRTEFFGHEPQGDSMLLAKGYHVVYMDLQNMYGAPVALDLMDSLYNYLVKQMGLYERVVLEGFSRGGLFAFNWAVRHPEQVAAIYGDAPVLDFKSWPGGKGRSKGSPEDWQRLLQVYGFTEAAALQYRGNPVDQAKPLAKAGIPVIIVCGAADTVVPVAENTAIFEKRYHKYGGRIEVISKPGVDHHPHSLKDPTPIVDFLLQYAR